MMRFLFETRLEYSILSYKFSAYFSCLQSITGMNELIPCAIANKRTAMQ